MLRVLRALILVLFCNSDARSLPPSLALRLVRAEAELTQIRGAQRRGAEQIDGGSKLDLCQSIEFACERYTTEGSVRAACVKASLERLLSDRNLLALLHAESARGQVHIPERFFLLCSAAHHAGLVQWLENAQKYTKNADNADEKLEAIRLMKLLQDSLRTMPSRNRTMAGAATAAHATAVERYRRAVSWSSFSARYASAGSAVLAAAKVQHFFSALRLVPDSLHNVDRLASALAEASSTATTTARLLLLHYALLRGMVHHPLQRPMRLIRGLSARPIWYTSAGAGRAITGDSKEAGTVHRDEFAWVARLRAPKTLSAMRAELLPVIFGTDEAYQRGSPRIQAQAEGLHVGGLWAELPLVTQAREERGAAARFPRTLAALRGCGAPDLLNARVSVLRANTHITMHCGVSNAKLRMHLGLHVPPTQLAHQGLRSAIRVGDQTLTWADGEAFVFDDSFEHEVWWSHNASAVEPGTNCSVNSGSDDNVNASSNVRVVLMVDVFHPELSERRRQKILQEMLAQDNRQQRD